MTMEKMVTMITMNGEEGVGEDSEIMQRPLQTVFVNVSSWIILFEG